MVEALRPVRIGILVGLFGLVFGIGWAFWLVVGHERIHQSLEARAALALTEKPESGKAVAVVMKVPEVKEAQKGHAHADGHGHDAETKAMHQEGPPQQGAHDSPIMETAHERLVRGHLHSMGLGLVTIVISLLLAFTTASRRIKAITPILAGIGGILYPFAWIVMGYRTPSLGADLAEASVTPIAGPGIALVLLGIFTAAGFLLKDIFKGK